MSFQAYLDNIETETGRSPDEFVTMAKERGYDSPDTKATSIVDWLKQDFGLGRGHAMALVYVIKRGPRSAASTWRGGGRDAELAALDAVLNRNDQNLSDGLHSPRTPQPERTGREDRRLKFYELRDNL